MTIVATVLQIVAPVFILAGIGALWVRSGIEYRAEFVTRLAMTLSLPCLIFSSLVKTEIGSGELMETLWACIVGYGVITLAFFALVRLTRLEVPTFLPPLIFGNTGNLGLPLAYFAFGQQGLDFAIIIFAFMTVYAFTLGIWMVSGGGSPLQMFSEPMVPATLLGALFLVMGWRLPVWATNTLDLVGQMAIPLMLLTLGVALSRLKFSRLTQAAWLSALRIPVCIAVAVATGHMFDLTPVPFAVLVLQISTPVAVTSYILAEKYGVDSEAVAGLVIVSTLMSVVAIPVTLAFLIPG